MEWKSHLSLLNRECNYLRVYISMRKQSKGGRVGGRAEGWAGHLNKDVIAQGSLLSVVS